VICVTWNLTLLHLALRTVMQKDCPKDVTKKRTCNPLFNFPATMEP